MEKTARFYAKNWSNKGFDGTVVDDSYDGWVDIEYAAFNQNQIKSAINNTGEFSVNNDDIRFSKALQKPERLEKLRQAKPIEITGNEIEPSDKLTPI